MPPLQWDDHCYQTAKSWCETMASESKMYHGGHGGMGQNCASSTGASLTLAQAVQLWYDEIRDYDFTGGAKHTGVVGHFTQVVWKGTSKVGMAKATAKDGSCYICANYSKPGNMRGSEKQNVFPKQE